MSDLPELNVFICSAGHSGSTLLDLLLGSHSNITSLGEVTQFPKNLALNTQCTCGSAVRECEFWNRVVDEVAARTGLNVRMNPYVLDLGFISARIVVDHDHQTKFYNIRRRILTGAAYLGWRYKLPGMGFAIRPHMKSMENNLLLYDVVRSVTGRTVVVDSTKHYMKAVGLYKADPNRTRVVLLTRDGRGVFYSNRRRGFGRKASLDTWRRHYARALPLFKRNLPPSSVMKVRYEELCRDPAAALARICDFVGLQFEESMLDFSRHEHHIANGNNMRFENSSGIRCDERWREEMTDKDMAYFSRHAWKLNQKLGYDA